MTATPTSSPFVRLSFGRDSRVSVTDLPWFAAVLHPYYKLAYIEKKWGGEEEYQADLAAGLPNARNWIAHARAVVESAVRGFAVA